jgi:hypothetical protein
MDRRDGDAECSCSLQCYSLGDAAEADVRYSRVLLYTTLTIDQGRRVSFLGCCTISDPERGIG